MNKKTVLFLLSVVAVFFMAWHGVSAHEVYVLNHQTVAYDVSHPSPNPLKLVAEDRDDFALASLVGVILVAVVFLISISRKVEDALDPLLMKAKRYAPVVARLTLGLSLIAAAYYHSLFGPEIPLTLIAGHYAVVVQYILYIIGIFILIGLFVRESAFIALIIFIVAVVIDKTYMLNYINYFGEIVFNMILGGGLWSVDHYFSTRPVANSSLAFHQAQMRLWKRKCEPYAFPILRVLFGIALIYASWYAKLFHASLALDTVVQYHLTNYFHFPALFVVLGAFIIETLIGLFFILGIEIRFTALFSFAFLMLSLSFFGEVVWPHLILIGVNVAFILHGYDKCSLEGYFFKKGKREPVL